MANERISILYNPTAGMGRALKRKLKLEHFLRHFEISYDLTMTQSEDDLKELTRQHVKKYRTLVGAGGDSTFHIMVNEIINTNPDANFGMISVGSSNEIAKEFGVDSLMKACQALRDRNIKKVDLGCIREGQNPLKYFLDRKSVV